MPDHSTALHEYPFTMAPFRMQYGVAMRTVRIPHFAYCMRRAVVHGYSCNAVLCLRDSLGLVPKADQGDRYGRY
jgi:hypothetical protein